TSTIERVPRRARMLRTASACASSVLPRAPNRIMSSSCYLAGWVAGGHSRSPTPRGLGDVPASQTEPPSCPLPAVRHNGVTLSLDHTWQGAASPYAKPLSVSRGSGNHGRGCLRRAVRDVRVLRARAEGDSYASARRQGPSL